MPTTVPLGLSAAAAAAASPSSNYHHYLANPVSLPPPPYYYVKKKKQQQQQQQQQLALLSRDSRIGADNSSSRSSSSLCNFYNNNKSVSPISCMDDRSVAVGVFKASQAVELFPPPSPSVSPEIVVREARLEDCWEVAETHCTSFFPDYTFPLDVALRIDRLVALLSAFSVPNGCRRICLVAVVGGTTSTTTSSSPLAADDDKYFFGTQQLAGFDGRRFSFNRGYVAGILTVDTVADFLPRKGPMRQRRTGIAYVSNVAVRESDRRKGIAKRLVMKAEAQAMNWGCRAIALHCDSSNPAATRLYKGQGFKCIKVPEKANWPQPKTSPDMHFNFMMKLLTTSTSN